MVSELLKPFAYASVRFDAPNQIHVQSSEKTIGGCNSTGKVLSFTIPACLGPETLGSLKACFPSIGIQALKLCIT